MRSLTPQLTPELAEAVGSASVAKAEPLPVRDFRSLMEYVARLAYLNKDHLLFFRGQGTDYKNRAGASTFYPTIYRGERVSRTELETRFDVLQSAGASLADAFARERIEGASEVKRRRIVQWSILQHYEVCPTPLLDFTQSLRVACSFAEIPRARDPHIYVFGLPYLTNRVSVNSEQDTIVVRLLSICPPSAFRPYFQEGYVAGTDEVTTEYQSKDELDFNGRLIAKFKPQDPARFWQGGFDPIPESALYPDNDRMKLICEGISKDVGNAVRPAELGQFLQAWSSLESQLLSLARGYKEKVYSVQEAVRVLHEAEQLGPMLHLKLDAVRQARNRAVHQPDRIKPGELPALTADIEWAKKMLSPNGPTAA
ncbi:MAG: FRG domain-containing protein [Rhodoferax sp.]|nr:FRG domain-containing protein [Rhodoferax sp.]